MAKRKATKNIDDSTNSDDSQLENRLSIPDRKLTAFSEKRSRISNINDLTQAGDFTQINTQQKFNPHPERCGIIERITLVNFKCHSFIEFDFHGYINFILGRNGSKFFCEIES
jgi:hypothetical protein